MTMVQTASQSQFAKLIGVHKSHVTRMKQAGRLVILENGMVDVLLSKQRITETADPARQDVAERHAIERGNTIGSESKNASYNDARARRESAEAEMAEIKLGQARKELLNAEDVRLFAADLGATFRAALETLPDRLAHELVPLDDADEIRAVLVDTFEQLLGDLSLKIGKMSGESRESRY